MTLLDEIELQLALGKDPGDSYANSDEPIFRKKGIMIVVTL